MPTYKGNRGNLLQHWVLAELATLLQHECTARHRLCFVDAHAMSPYATRDSKPGQTAADFDRVRDRLPGQSSRYEDAWHSLLSRLPRCKYPTSAALLRELWQGTLHLLLCEADADTAKEIDEWLPTLGRDTKSELYRGDWRVRFRQGIPAEYDAYLVSFDPYMFDRNGPPASRNQGNMYPIDLIRACAALIELPQHPALVQLSTFSANNRNSQHDVIKVIDPVLRAAGFARRAPVLADGHMMSLIFFRDVSHSAVSKVSKLRTRFRKWLQRTRESQPAKRCFVRRSVSHRPAGVR
jgi:hypothetical protein